MDKGIIVQEGAPERIFTGSEKLSNLKLELPQIAQLMEVLRDKEKLPLNQLSLTIGQARQELERLFSREGNVQHAGSILLACIDLYYVCSGVLLKGPVSHQIKKGSYSVVQ